MPQPKPFQVEAIMAACATLSAKRGSRRFLIADEVGLGKTVVAQQVIERLAGTDRRSPFVVYYITNGQRVAHQNRERLVDFLPPDEQGKAVSRADRLNLIPLLPKPTGRVALYALTPGTSFPGKTTRLHAGKKEERAFLTALLTRTYPRLVRRFPEKTMQRNVTSDWEKLVRRHRQPVAELPRAFIYAFKAALVKEFGGWPKERLPEVAREEPPGRFVGRLRRALAYTVLTARPPDLVILDEFQRYRDLLSKQNRADPLVEALFEPKSASTGLLLLSATPYKLFATRLEENRAGEANREFFELLEFLGGKSGPALHAEAKDVFARFGSTVLAIAKAAPLSELLPSLIEDGRSLRARLQAMLASYVSRMEREPASDDSAHTIPLGAALDPADIRAFRHLATSFKPEHAWTALPYWLSVPLPAQALGSRYQAWREGTIRKDRSLTKLTLEGRRTYSLPRVWPSPKLRALEQVTDTDTLALPWVRPSIPWWPLRGSWAQADREPKLLVFSRFRATPQSLAALTSLRVEARLLARKETYDQVWKRRRLQAGPGRLPTIALFHPSPFLIRVTDPLLRRDMEAELPRALVRKQLNHALKALGVEVVRGRGKKALRRRPLWLLLSALETRAGDGEITKVAWRQVAQGDQRLETLVQEWHARRDLDSISRRELDDMVMAAMASPGVIVGRALSRHFPGCLDPSAFHELVRLSWHALRPYLDNPVFLAAMPNGKPVKVLQQAYLDGNLEAVLDEHFWMRRQSLPKKERGLVQDLHEALSVSVGSFSFHSANPAKTPRIRVRCHAAVPFGSTEDDERDVGGAAGDQSPSPPRSDEIRNAFNSPFWPHVLATTSVGQEGLDFHTWCSRILHWDLCSSPLELEQREGRIQRYAGLAVRRRLADLVKAELGEALPDRSSLWDRVESIANDRYVDASGLSPWWVLPGAHVDRFVFNLPQSRDLDRFKLLKEQRLIYRIALGQPNQEDLVEFLTQGGPAVTALLKPLALDLSAFGRIHSLVPNRAEPPEINVQIVSSLPAPILASIPSCTPQQEIRAAGHTLDK